MHNNNPKPWLMIRISFLKKKSVTIRSQDWFQTLTSESESVHFIKVKQEVIETAELKQPECLRTELRQSINNKHNNHSDYCVFRIQCKSDCCLIWFRLLMILITLEEFLQRTDSGTYSFTEVPGGDVPTLFVLWVAAASTSVHGHTWWFIEDVGWSSKLSAHIHANFSGSAVSFPPLWLYTCTHTHTHKDTHKTRIPVSPGSQQQEQCLLQRSREIKMSEDLLFRTSRLRKAAANAGSAGSVGPVWWSCELWDSLEAPEEPAAESLDLHFRAAQYDG